MSLVWVVTGTSSGFGNELVHHLLKRGEKVIATGRKLAALESLKAAGAHTLELDVTAPLDKLHAVAKEAVGIHGRVDVVVNNAGYLQAGTIEESTPEETLQQYNTNVFGALNVARAFLPYQRAAKSGTVLFIGSVGGWRGASIGGLYASTKHAIRALAESLDLEIAPLGLRSLYLEPGYFRTSFLTDGNRTAYQTRIPDYAPLAERYNGLVALSGNQPGDPEKFVEVLVDYVRREGAFAGAGDEYPSGLLVGSDAYGIVKERLNRQLAINERWKDVICSTDLPK